MIDPDISHHDHRAGIINYQIGVSKTSLKLLSKEKPGYGERIQKACQCHLRLQWS